MVGIFRRERPPRILWARMPTGAAQMADYSQMFAAVADLALQRRYRRQIEVGDLDPLAAAAQALYLDWEDQQEATLVLRDVLVIRREFGEDGLVRSRDRHAMVAYR